MTERNRNMPIEVVDITTPALNSMLGRYFIGQTDLLNFGNRWDAWGGIVNPIGSGVNLYFDIFTITNFSAQSFVGEIWLNARPPRNAKPSSTVTPSNQAIFPPPKPKAIMLDASNVTKKTPTDGIYTFTRRVEPNQTLTKHDFQGMYIIPPGSSFALFFLSPGKELVQSRLAFGWWEESDSALFI